MPVIEIWLKIILFIINLASLYFSLYNLFACSYTEPGIIPALKTKKDLPYRATKDIISNMEYYVLYKDKHELDNSLDRNVGPAEKFYNLDKFKYQEPVRDQETSQAT